MLRKYLRARLDSGRDIDEVGSSSPPPRLLLFLFPISIFALTHLLRWTDRQPRPRVARLHQPARPVHTYDRARIVRGRIAGLFLVHSRAGGLCVDVVVLCEGEAVGQKVAVGYG